MIHILAGWFKSYNTMILGGSIWSIYQGCSWCSWCSWCSSSRTWSDPTGEKVIFFGKPQKEAKSPSWGYQWLTFWRGYSC
jgi:hypothetical protein